MLLYNLPANNFKSLFGTVQDPIPRNNVNIIAQKHDCSAFLVLSNTAYPEFEAFTSYDGYDFTYCQAWGLTINDEVVARTILDLRKNAYPSIGDQLDALFHAGIFPTEMANLIASVKTKYPKQVK
jgi:hypothetical protein